MSEGGFPGPNRAPRLHIRPGMDVFSAYQDQFIGSVVGVYRDTDSRTKASDTSDPSGRTAAAVDQGEDAIKSNPPLVHEEDHAVSPTAQAGRKQLGEEMGPFPTIGVGNTGPVNQSAAHAYGTEREDPLADVRWFTVRPGRINLGPLTPPIYVPTSAIRSLSMERIVIGVQRDQIPAQWRHRP